MPNWANVEKRFGAIEMAIAETSGTLDKLREWAHDLAVHRIDAFRKNPPRNRSLNLSANTDSQRGGNAAFRYLLQFPQAITELKELRSLDISALPISDISMLAELRRLEHVDASDTQVAELWPLRELESLATLALDRTRVKDLSPLAEVTSLESISLNGTPVKDLSPLRNLSKLEELQAAFTKVRDLSPLADLKSILVLGFGSTKVRDLSPLRNLKSLERLDLGTTKVMDLSPIEGLRSLENLNLSKTNIVDFSPVAMLPSLESLNVSGPRSDGELPIRGSRILRELDLSEIRDLNLSGMVGLTALERLNLRNAEVRNIAPVILLRALQWIDISGIPALDNDPELRRIAALDESVRAQSLLAYLNSDDYPPEEPEIDDTLSDDDEPDAPTEPEEEQTDRASRSSLEDEYTSIAKANVGAVRSDAADLKIVLTANLEYARRHAAGERPNELPPIFVDFDQLDTESANNLKALFGRMVSLLDRFDDLLQSDKPSDSVLADLRRLWLEQSEALKRDVMLWMGTTAVATAVYTVAPPIAAIAMLFGLPVLSKGRRAKKITKAILKAAIHLAKRSDADDSD